MFATKTPPNPRVQRTRVARCARPGSPLTRHPFCGDHSPGYTFRDARDIDGDGQPEPLAHRLLFFSGAPNSGGLGGVRLFWRRRLSPAPAVATYGDVPTTHPFFPYVEALSASGITAGCGSESFCPDRPLTRGQMAVFLAKALGLQ